MRKRQAKKNYKRLFVVRWIRLERQMKAFGRSLKSMRKSKFKIKSISVEGWPEDIRIDPLRWENSRNSISGACGRKMPSIYELESLGHENVMELWWQKNKITQITTTMKDGRVIRQETFAGFIYDKVSSPVGRNNWLPALIPARGHDLAFSNKVWAHEEENGDGGFRAANMFFYCQILWFVEEYYKDDLKFAAMKDTIAKRFFARIACRMARGRRRRMAKLYFLAVNSIAGRAIYENCNRAWWHEKTSGFHDSHSKIGGKS